MRAVAFSVWIFINLAFLGMGGYIYLIISTYWCRKIHTSVQPMPHKKAKFDRKNQIIFYETKDVFHEPKTSIEISAIESKYNVTKYNFIFKHLYRLRRKTSDDVPCSNKFCSDSNNKRESNLEAFKNKLFIQLRRVVHEESNVFKTDNPYSVNYKGPKGKFQRLSSDDIKCKLRKVGLKLINKDDSPFNRNKFRNIIGEDKFLNGIHFNTCAIVSSAGSLINSGLGQAIDEHDIVLRFNHAPTEHYEKDVGTKTTIRLVNSQVVSKKEFQFTSSPLYKNVTLVVWDPSNYTATLKQWFHKPDYNFFESWAEQKIRNSKKNSFILNPKSVWKTWDVLQSLTPLRIRKNPPSSGFLGLVLLMPHCDVIDFFEYIPSIRITKRCHYFDNIHDESCTFGVWHPLSAEKLLSVAMNEVNDTTVFKTGFIRIKGYKTLKC